ncbi:hypothetical protein MBANPS3_001392 [Mucor bainieri]
MHFASKIVTDRDIQLISLSDIRYVGILHNINQVESTVALQNVKSHGTEGRKNNPGEEIPPSDNTFDYVVFRGSDIKDLQVFEAPPAFQPEQQTQKPVQKPNPVMEPVVNAAPYNYPPSNMAATYYSTPNMFSNGKDHSASDYGSTYGTASNQWQGNGNVAAYNPYIQQPRYQMPVPENYQTAPSAPPAAAISDLNMNESGVSPPSKKEYKVEEEKIVASPKKEVPAANLTSTSMQVKVSQEKEEVAPVIEQVDEALLNSLVKQVSDLDIKQPPSVTKQKSPVRQQKQKQQSQPTQTNDGSNARVGGGNGSNRGRRNSARNPTKSNSTRTNGNANSAWEPNNLNGNRGVSNGHRNSSGNIPRRNSGIVIPKSDFDFESSNAKFDKNGMNTIDDIGQANEEEAIIIPEADHFYDRKKSFFDDISCESKEYQKGNRGKYKEESMLNLETFGQANPAGQNGKRNRHRGGRGGRGRQHRNGRGKATSTAENSNGQVV